MRRRVIVIGATGFLGATLTRRLARDHAVLGVARHPRQDGARFDFHTDDVGELLRAFPADIVVFAASVERPDVVARTDRYLSAIERFLASLDGIRLVYTSSDAVFDGGRGRYSETDPPAPVTEYGSNLLLFEELVRAACPDHCIVRPSYLYGFGADGLDRRLAHARRTLLAGGQAEYSIDLFKSPMEIGEVVEAVCSLAVGGATGTVHVSGPRSSIFDFYLDAMTALGVPADRIQATRLSAGTTVPRDTSLACAHMTALTGIVPRSVRDSLDGADGRT